jgi:hypothetical protein
MRLLQKCHFWHPFINAGIDCNLKGFLKLYSFVLGIKA